VEAFVNFQKALELHAKAHNDENQINALRRANQLLETVIEKVPTYPPAYIDHSDLFVHLLLDDSVGTAIEGATRQEIDAAQENAVTDMTMAAEHARNFSERNDIELDLAYMTGNWHGLQGNIERFLASDGCNQAQWVPGIIALYGIADRYAPRATEFRKCDPMRSHSWFDESRAYLWAGDKEEALKVAREGNDVAPGEWLAIALVRALVANGLFEETDHAMKTYISSKENLLVAKLTKTAAMGDRETSAMIIEELLSGPRPANFWKSISSAWVGDRETANRLAAKIDEHPFGSQSLLLVVYWCACGAPWDIEATPNFAASIEEAGMPWPPYSPITFPLKDW
jgi:hypothetical protein